MKKFLVFFIMLNLVIFSSCKKECQYTNGELLQDTKNRKVFVIDNCVKRWIVNGEVFGKHNYKWEDVKDVTSEILDKIETGDDLDK